jgi:hypothetical protein
MIVTVQFKHVPPHKPRWWFPAFGAVALVVLGCVIAIAVALAQSAPDFADVPGPDLTQPARAEIERADCAGLRELHARYLSSGGDSVDPGVTALQLVRKRMTTLNCPPVATD